MSAGGVTAQAVAGNHAVFFGFDLDANARPDCLGFAIHRTDHTENENHWLSGFKTFKSLVPDPKPDEFYPSTAHPLQTFYWGDYTAKPGHSYTYRIVPRYGAPSHLADKPGAEVSLDLSTNDPTQGVHGIYFNRGVAASQAYANKFGDTPNKLSAAKRKAALEWLSRGLMEAILAFIGQAGSADFALRAAVYEFTQRDVLDAFRAAHDHGADVKIVYHALDDETGIGNRKAIEDASLPDTILDARKHAALAHNKFIVLCRKQGEALDPVSVWTGSTNLSQGGIYGHSNVGHEVRDAEIAARYLAVWGELAGDPELDPLRDWATANSGFDPDTIASDGVRTVFSPRHGLAPLRWYADQYGTPTTAAYITQPFGMGEIFEKAVTDHPDSIHYAMLDFADSNQDAWAGGPKVFVAVGSAADPDDLSRWAKEELTGFNHHVPYLHTKILLVDPLSESPLVVSGSANFSPNSTNLNDENMLVIPGENEVADVYFTEYARIFNHFYARYWASQLHEAAAGPDAAGDTRGFLEETDAWQDRYFKDGNPKELQRVLYSAHVEGNQ
jgi:phosphatidylserine/phosphatidylglycerophosphate/cardiolipin synthase-like enzyme